MIFFQSFSHESWKPADTTRMTAVITPSERTGTEQDRFPGVALSPAHVVSRPIQVLLIEDNDEHAEWITLLVSEDRDERFEIERVANLEQAMIHLSKAPPDVVLLDLGMPELEGYRSYAAVRAVTLSTPVVILTGDESWLSKALTLDSGVRDYLLKSSISPQQLRDALRRAYQSGKRRAG
jgi:DNA-binding response OmpR family regulator